MSSKLKRLDIDIECLPGHWIAADYVSKIITAVAWMDIDRDAKPRVLTHYDHSPEEMAQRLADEIRKSDLVIGHYIRGFDLRLLNGNLLRGGLEPLESVLTHDTKGDLAGSHGRSLSQKNLGAMLGIEAPKIDVTLHDWEKFNTRTPGSKNRGIERVVGDVIQNVELYAKLKEIGWLGPPRTWNGGSGGGYRA